MNRYLEEAVVPELMTIGKTTLIQKDPYKGTTPNNYRPIIGLSMIWPLLMAQIRKKVYNFLKSRGLFPEEQKGCYTSHRHRWVILH